MRSRASLPEEIATALARGATVLTGNQRAARTLRASYNAGHAAAGQTTWAAPAILAWDSWTASLWHTLLLEGHFTSLLLNRAQEHALWATIVAQDASSSSLMSTDALAKMAADAWSMLCAYRGEGRLRTAGVSADTRAFQQWAKHFDARCRADDLLSPAQLESRLTAAFADGQLAPARDGYVLVGFDANTPAHTAVLSAIQQVGGNVEELSFSLPHPAPQLLMTETPEEELRTAARWLRQRLDAQPDARLALIVPSLEGKRAEIDRMLRLVLAPERENIAASADTAPFEFSLGVPLAKTPLVRCALDLLRWPVDALPLEHISSLLLTPCFASEQEIAARAGFDAYELRRGRMLRPELSLEALLRRLESAKRVPQLQALLHALRALRRVAASEEVATGTRSHADWTDAMRELLRAAQWGGTRDSVGFQTQRRWDSVLDGLATLDFTGVRVSYRQALSAVERLAGETLFAPESQGAPVQVMGALESAGSVFDAAWFLGAGDLQWSVPAAPSPLLSWQLRRELGMPGTQSARDHERAEHSAKRVAGCAPEVVFSFAHEVTEGKQRPSPALSTLSMEQLTPAELLVPEPPRAIVALETIDDSTTLPPVPDRVIRGGATVIKLQAACGFRAFAEQRLWANAVDPVEAGMNARERGSAVHSALEHFWKQVRTQDELKALTTDERRAALSEAIQNALAPTAGKNEGAWDAAYIDVQCERLLKLLDAWMTEEAKRPVPFLVKVSEIELKDVRIGPLRLSLRVDRIDETEFGDVILDYKTGAARALDWLSERPDEPQLPLYAVLTASPGSSLLAGVAFAEVRAGKDMALSGYQTTDGVLLKAAKLTVPTLEDQVEAWRQTLTVLAEDFHRGDVRVRPKAYPHTCQFCAQRLLCRLDAASLKADTSEDGEDVEGENDGG